MVLEPDFLRKVELLSLPPGHFPGEVCWACSSRRGPRADPGQAGETGRNQREERVGLPTQTAAHLTRISGRKQEQAKFRNNSKIIPYKMCG